jgi:hypothetical protein
MRRRNRIVDCVSILVGLAVVVWYLYLFFSHSDMTQARLLQTFWKQYLAGFCLLIFAIMIQSLKG